MAKEPQNSANAISLVAVVTCLLAADAPAANPAPATPSSDRDLSAHVAGIIERLNLAAPKLTTELSDVRRFAQWGNR